MKKNTKHTLFFILISLFIGLIVLEIFFHPLHKLIDNYVYDNKAIYVPCRKLPSMSEVERVVQEHQELIAEIEAVDPGFIFVSIISPCPGKGAIQFAYPGHSQREKIEELIGGDTFFGIPYRLINI